MQFMHASLAASWQDQNLVATEQSHVSDQVNVFNFKHNCISRMQLAQLQWSKCILGRNWIISHVWSSQARARLHMSQTELEIVVATE